MDKYEFNIKVEQIKKMVTKGDFETSMRIADTIDWRRVRSANLLSMISQVYEKNGEYQEAKEVLLLAYERAPIGKRLLFKLTELALKEGSIREAEDYYREFCELAQDDPRQYLLRYMILKEKKVPNEQLIGCLERYVSQELDERWMYELASLYEKAGQQHKCVQMCDRIMLMFAFGKYVDKAMDLKVRYAPLSEYQLDLMRNKEKYEAKLKVVEQKFDEETLGGYDEESTYSTYSPESYGGNEYGQNPYSQEEYGQENHIQGQFVQENNFQEQYPQTGYVQEGYSDQQYPQEGYNQTEYSGQPYSQRAYIQDDYPQEQYSQEGYAQADYPGQPYAQTGYSQQDYPGQPYAQTGYSQQNYSGQPYAQAGYGQQGYPGQPYVQAEYSQQDYSGQPYVPAESGQENYLGQPYSQEEYPSQKTYIPSGYPRVNIPQEQYPQEGHYRYYNQEDGNIPVEASGFSEKVTSEEPAYVNIEEEPGAIDEELVVNLHQDDIQQELAKEMSKISEGAVVEQEPVSMQTKVPSRGQDNIFQTSDDASQDSMPGHLLIEAKTPEEGLETAVKILKQIHTENGSNNQVAKITGAKLNQKGIWNIADVLAGKDLVVEEAGDLTKEQMIGLQQLAAEDTSGMNIILIDNPRQIEELYQQNPELASIFECVSMEQSEALAPEAPVQEPETDSQVPEEVVSAGENPEEDKPATSEEPSEIESVEQTEAELEPELEPEPEPEGEFDIESEVELEPEAEFEPESEDESEEELESEAAEEFGPEPEDDEEMDLDDFAEYATRYASEIDCSITGKSMLALYERIEIMEEDGIPLTKANAEEMIEEAADRAEKPPLGKLIKGMFNSKYDKEGLLILREEHFI